MTRAISGIRPKADEISSLLGSYATYSGNSLQTFRDNLSGPSSGDMVFSFVTGQYTLNIGEWPPENGTDWLSRNVRKELDHTLRNIPEGRRCHVKLWFTVQRCISDYI
jgi:hypothetical protein